MKTTRNMLGKEGNTRCVEFQILVDTVSEVMELEQQLEELTEQTNGFKSALHFQTNDNDDATKQDADCQVFGSYSAVDEISYQFNLICKVGNYFSMSN